MRVTAPRLCDMTALHPDLNLGKWSASLDLRVEADRETLRERELVLEADVFLQGYRPGVLESAGLGRGMCWTCVGEGKGDCVLC